MPGPSEVDSVTFYHITVSGLMEGDQESVIESVEERFTGAGWTVVLVEPLDVSGSPASEGNRVVATRDGLAAHVVVSDQAGVTRHPPQGSSIGGSVRGSPRMCTLSADRRRRRFDRVEIPGREPTPITHSGAVTPQSPNRSGSAHIWVADDSALRLGKNQSRVVASPSFI